jgi:two-component system, response regulator PdtaR
MAGRPAPVILIVDDDPFLRMLAVEFVNEAGFETLEACDADQAIAVLILLQNCRAVHRHQACPEAWTV